MNATHLIIFNRAEEITDAHGWIHIVPKGELPNREAGVLQVLDDSALDSILANIAADQKRLGAKWPGIYAGREHFIYNDEQDSAALAWFKNFEKRADGIWARRDGLTDIGEEAIKNARYKFTSFVADRRDTTKLEGNKVRILKLDTIGFTNQANGKELLTPITNRNTFPGPDGPADNQKQNKGPQMKSVCTLLGLSADADETSVHAAVLKLQNRITTLEPLDGEIKTLRNRNTELEGEQVEALMDAHGLKPDDKARTALKPVLIKLSNRAERLTFLTDCVKVETPNPEPGTRNQPQHQLRNRDTKPPGKEQKGGTEGEEETFETAAEKFAETHKITNRQDAQVRFAGTPEGRDLYKKFRQGLKPAEQN